MKRLIQMGLVLVLLVIGFGSAAAAPLGQEGDGEGEGSDYIVKAGDGLIELARLFFAGNDDAYLAIVRATNEHADSDSTYRHITDPNIILVGQKLFIPGVASLPQVPAVPPAGSGTGSTAGSGATPPAVPQTGDPAFLAGTNWALTSLNGAAPVAGTSPFINFESAVQSGGNTGCNGFGASYATDGFHISFGPTFGTLIACEEPIHAQEQALYAMLENAEFVAITDDNLQLFDGDSTLLGQFAPGTTGLQKTAWVVTGYNNGNQAVVSVLGDEQLTATFTAEGEISGSTGCNDYFGTYAIDGNAISIGPLASTRRVCAEDDLNAQEAQFLAALESAAVYQIRGDTLDLRTAEDALAVTMRLSQ